MAPEPSTEKDPRDPLKKHKRRMACTAIPLLHFWDMMSATLGVTPYKARTHVASCKFRPGLLPSCWISRPGS